MIYIQMENNVPYGILVQEGIEGVPYDDYLAVESIDDLPEGFEDNYAYYRYVGDEFIYDASLIITAPPEAYREVRAESYPNIGDQLDSLFHAGAFTAEMMSQIQAVKDAFPKPTDA
tara:strand:- start:3791 stop:4138 length:348 start_codon:yes stop_codon:yes gene_type:complete